MPGRTACSTLKKPVQLMAMMLLKSAGSSSHICRFTTFFAVAGSAVAGGRLRLPSPLFRRLDGPRTFVGSLDQLQGADSRRSAPVDDEPRDSPVSCGCARGLLDQPVDPPRAV